MISLVICIVFLVAFIAASVFHDYRKHKKIVDSCKPGQVFHYKQLTINPFDKPIETDILIVDTKKNQYGEMYVKFIVGDNGYEQSYPLKKFYYMYLIHTDYDSK